MSFNDSILTPIPETNVVNLDHDRLFSMDMGKLVPVLVTDVLPGDRWNIKVEHMTRFAPMQAPVMHNMYAKVLYWYIPYDILWPNWRDFIEDFDTPPVFPTVRYDAVQAGHLSDYMRIPVGTYPDPLIVSAMYLSAYAKCIDEWYRDQNLQPTDRWFPLADGDNTAAFIGAGLHGQPINVCWEKDLYTSSLPWQQKGNPVTLPLGTTANLTFDPTSGDTNFFTPAGADSALGGVNLGVNLPNVGLFDSGGVKARIDVTKNHLVDLTNATAATINDLRRAEALQQFLELDARAGTRYNEKIWAHWHVRTPDATLHRPQYMGGYKSNVVISEVLQTSESSTTPQGTMAGHGINIGQSRRIGGEFTQHGCIIGIMHVLPKTMYFQGLPKHFRKFDAIDFGWPLFAHLGEDSVKNSEIYAQQGAAARDGIFGYQERNYEYRSIENSIHGDFVSTMDFWHFGRKFATPPALNSDFVTADPTTAPFAVVTGVHHLWVHLFHNISVVRKLPRYGVPRLT